MHVWDGVCCLATEGIVKDHVYMKRSVISANKFGVYVKPYMLPHIQHCIIEYEVIDHTHWTYACLELTDFIELLKIDVICGTLVLLHTVLHLFDLY